MWLKDLFARYRIVEEFGRQNLFACSFNYRAELFVRPEAQTTFPFASTASRAKKRAAKSHAGRKTVSGQILDAN